MVLLFQEISHVDSQKYKEGKSVLELWESFLDLLFSIQTITFPSTKLKKQKQISQLLIQKWVWSLIPKCWYNFVCLFATGLRLWVLMIAKTWFVKKFHNLWSNNHMIQMMLKLFSFLRFLFICTFFDVGFSFILLFSIK